LRYARPISELRDKAMSKSFIGFLFVVILSCVGAYFYISYKEEFINTNIAVRNLDSVYASAQYEFQLYYPNSCKVDEYPFQVRPWVRSNEGITGEGPWGTIYPQLSNGLVTETVALDHYMRAYFVEMIRPEKYEFYRFQVEVCDGLPAWTTLDDFGLASKTLPQATRLDIQEKDIKRAQHPRLGEYEEAQTVYSAGVDLTFYARQRVYLAGKRRFVVTAITNYTMLSRVQELFENFFAQGFEIDLEAANATSPKSDEELLQEGQKLFAEAEGMIAEAPEALGNEHYRAYLRYQAALQQFQEMTERTPEFNAALQATNALRGRLQERLQALRDETRDKMNRSRYDQAKESIAKFREMLKSNNESYKPNYVEEWIIWCDHALDSLNEGHHNISKPYLKWQDK
jgi:hypothetical protein